jgi:hypothetical protein
MPNDPELLRKWVDTWRRAEPELDRIRRAELQALDTREAVRQIFGTNVPIASPAPASSGLVEQQAWFARLRNARPKF